MNESIQVFVSTCFQLDMTVSETVPLLERRSLPPKASIENPDHDSSEHSFGLAKRFEMLVRRAQDFSNFGL